MPLFLPKPGKTIKSFRARSAQMGILVLGFFLLVLSIAAFGLTRHIIEIQERQLGDYLQPVARGIAEPPRDYFWFLEIITIPETGDIDDQQLYDYSQMEFSWQELARSIQGSEEIPFIGSIHLLSPSGEIIMDGEGNVVPIEERRRFIDEDSTAIRAASGGEPSAPEFTRRDMVKRLYYPIRNQQGSVVALIRLQSNAEYLNELYRMRRTVFFGFVVTVLLFLSIYFLTMRLVRRTIEAERMAARSDRLRALGTLTAGMAHEIRNPLGIISLQVEELRAISADLKEDKQKKDIQDLLVELDEEANRLKALVKTFLQFSKSSFAPPQKTAMTKLSSVVDPLVKLWSKGLNSELREVVYTNDGGDVMVQFEGDNLRQVILNLLRNADEALGNEKGRIAIDVKRQGSFVILTVSDNGPGIDKNDLEQIFDPFYTTRSEGTGLGLALCRSLARANGGDVTVVSTRGKETTFTVQMKVVG